MNSKRILILFQFDANKHLLERLAHELTAFGLKADLFNSRTFAYSGKTSLKLKMLQFLIRIPKMRVLVYKLFREKTILSISNHYDLIDIHFFSAIYDDLIQQFNKPVKVVFWGSDLYRISENRLKNLNSLLSKVKTIQFLTPEMNTFASKWNITHEKVCSQPFGVVHFDQIRKIKNQKEIAQIKSTLGFNPVKTVVAIGYNASPNQQHIEIIQQVSKLQTQLKKQIELLFLMTYGGSADYIQQVKNELKIAELDFKMVTNHLTEELICKYRLASDITLNFQTSDGFSSSIQEHFFAGNIMLLANWLPYEWLREKGLNFHSSSIEHITPNLEELLKNITEEKQLSLLNTELIEKISDWKFVAAKWAEIYKQTLEN